MKVGDKVNIKELDFIATVSSVSSNGVCIDLVDNQGKPVWNISMCKSFFYDSQLEVIKEESKKTLYVVFHKMNGRTSENYSEPAANFYTNGVLDSLKVGNFMRRYRFSSYTTSLE